VQYLGFASPQPYGPSYMYLIITAVILGGQRTFFGPLLGLAILTAINEAFRDLVSWVPLVYGAIVILVLRLFPDGLIATSFVRRFLDRRGAGRRAVGVPES
jgi:branched-chain amino acid transport system permease protein